MSRSHLQIEIGVVQILSREGAGGMTSVNLGIGEGEGVIALLSAYYLNNIYNIRHVDFHHKLS